MGRQHQPKGLTRPCFLLIVIAGMERFAFKGVVSNLVTYLTDVVKMSNSSAARTVNNWCGLTSIMPLLVAPLAESFWDRYWTILLSSFFYVMGLVAVTFTAISRTNWFSTKHGSTPPSSMFFFGYLSLISVGQGGYNPSLQALAADQLGEEEDEQDEELVPDEEIIPLKKFNHDDDDKAVVNDDDDDEEAREQKKPSECKNKNSKQHFFSCWYIGICSGSLMGVSVMAYVEDFIGWGLGFGIPTMVMVLSMLLLLFGRLFLNFYSRHSNNKLLEETKDDDSRSKIIRPLFEKIKSAAKEGIWKKIVVHYRLGDIVKYSSPGYHKENQLTDLEIQKCSSPLYKLKNTSVEDGRRHTINESSTTPTPSTLLQKAKVVLRLLPIWTTLLIFAVIFQQPITFFTKQGMTMNHTIKINLGTTTTYTFKIPPSTLQTSITISILILMPLYDRILTPLAKTITRNKNGISVTQRMGIGMVLSTLAMTVAALVESKRLKEYSTTTTSETHDVSMSIIWLLPQYVLLGVSDVFTVVGMQEFFYGQVPVEMRTTGLALNTSVYGVGSFLSAVLIELIELFSTGGGGGRGWFSDDMREARIDKYYLLLAGLSVVSMVVYVILCRFYTKRDDDGYDTVVNEGSE